MKNRKHITHIQKIKITCYSTKYTLNYYVFRNFNSSAATTIVLDTLVFNG